MPPGRTARKPAWEMHQTSIALAVAGLYTPFHRAVSSRAVARSVHARPAAAASIASAALAAPSAYRSATSTAYRVRSSTSARQALRQQATANRRAFLLAAAERPIDRPTAPTMTPGLSTHASHSASVIVGP